MNDFIEKVWTDPQYNDMSVKFSPVEVINGEPSEAVRFIYEVSPFVPLDQSEIDDYYFDFEEAFRESREMAVRLGEDTKFEPKEDAIDYVSKRKHLNEFTYICPSCFRELDDCRCASYSYFLVQIDKLIVPFIRVLNKKGYTTTACCSGHIEEDHCCSIYVAFKDEHDFGSNLPDGAVYSKAARTVSYHGLDKMNTEERTNFQKDCIARFMEWADALPNI